MIDSRAASRRASSRRSASRRMTGAQVSHVHGTLGVEAIDVIDASGRATKDRVRRARGVGRLESGRAPDLPSQRQAGLERGACGFRARRGAATACIVAGAAGRQIQLADCLPEGHRGRPMPAIECGFRIAVDRAAAATDDEPTAIAPLWHVKDSRAKAFVDFQNDVTTKDIALADQEGFRSVEHLKRYTTLGMATDQGKVVATCRAWRSSPSSPAARSRRSAPRPIAPPYVPVASARWPGIIAARTSARRGCRRRIAGRPNRARCSSSPGQWLRAQ